MSDRKGDWIQTFTGLKMYPLDPHPDEICIVDIAHALSNICRFTGHCDRFYSVAEHCCAVADWLMAKNIHRDTVFSGLMHDASEAYLCDLAAPVKRSAKFAQAYHDAECELMAAISDRFNFPWPPPTIIREADGRMLATEAQQLMSPTHPDWKSNWEPIPDLVLPCWNPRYARSEFLERYEKFTGQLVFIK